MNDDIIGTGWSFPPHFSKSAEGGAGVIMHSGVEEIEDSLSVLFSTQLGNRLFRPNFGCSVEEFQFRSIDSATEIRLKRMIENAVTEFEPRIILQSLDVDLSDLPEGKLRIDLRYSLKASYVKENIIYPYHFENDTL
jgi:hypothetical protein